MNIFKAELDTIHQNGVIGPITQFDNATLELQILTGGQVGESWNSPEFELIAMKRDMNPVREVDQDKFTILSKEEHRVRIELKEQFLTCQGTVKMQLIIKDGGRTSTTIFRLSIGQSLDATIVESLKDIKVLDDLDEVVELVSTFEVTATNNEATRQHNEKLREVAESNRQDEFDKAQSQRDTEFNEKMEEYREYVISLEGIQGPPGETLQIRVNETHIQVKYPSQQDWTDLIALEKLKGLQGPQGELGPKGDTGEQGIQGQTGKDGVNGKDGITPNLTIGTVTTLEPGQEATVTIRGTKENPILDIAIPRGEKGKDGQGGGSGVSASDKVDYMGEQHDSLKETNDANVEYLLREINTAHYEGSNITATDTYQKQVKSAILKGVTLVNVRKTTSMIAGVLPEIRLDTSLMKANTKYSVFVTGVPSDRKWAIVPYVSYTNNQNATFVTSVSLESQLKFYISLGDVMTVEELERVYITIVEGDAPLTTHFEGMQSVKMPVLKATGKNLVLKPQYGYVANGNIQTNITAWINSDYVYVKGLKDIVGSTSSDITGTTNIFTYNKDKKLLRTLSGHHKATLNEDEYYVIFSRRKVDNSNITSEELENCQMQLECGTVATSYEPYKTNILTLDGEYRGIGDVCDTVDLVTGEKVERIGEVILDGSGNWGIENPLTNDEYIYFKLNDPNTIQSNVPTTMVVNVLTDKLKISSYVKEASTKSNSYFQAWTSHFIGILRTELSTQDVVGFKEWLSKNPITVQLPLSTESIKTVDLNNQKVYSYDGTTHYTCSAAEGSLVPILSIDVPTNLPALVSRQRQTIETQKDQIQTLENENTQLIAQNEVQDTDIALNQDAINFMLFAPSVKSFNEDKGELNTMAAYLANQILKGRLDYTLVISRYSEFKEDIDTILIAEGKQDLIIKGDEK